MTRTLSKSQQAYQWVKERIATGEYGPGYRLVLGTIADDLSMSVVPVREAIRQLEAERLIEFEHNVGARVAMIDDSHYRDSMEALAVLEATATALAAPLLSADAIGDARGINAQMIASLEDFDPSAFTELNHRFHETLVSSCPNPRIHELVIDEWARLARLRSSTFSFVPSRARDSVQEHEALLSLIEQGADPREIEQAARHHQTQTLSAYLTHEHPGEFVRIPAL